MLDFRLDSAEKVALTVMQILFVHSHFPAQFGPILSRLAGREDVECVFVTMAATGTPTGVRCIRLASREEQRHPRPRYDRLPS